METIAYDELRISKPEKKMRLKSVWFIFVNVCKDYFWLIKKGRAVLNFDVSNEI